VNAWESGYDWAPMKKPLVVAALSTLFLVLVGGGTAKAENDPSDCPPGSAMKTEGTFSWCNPSVCNDDSGCLPNEVCRPMALCVQIGVMSGDGGAVATNKESRLIATTRCGPDKTCPSTTTCSDKSRCIDKQKADKMGILAAAPAASASSGSAPSDAKKSSCGCSTIGDRTSSGAALLAFALGAAAIRARRRKTN
jgi:MYXO-CTERM domain-containing protein